MSKELGKDSDHKLPITQKDLKVMVASSPDVIRALALRASLSLISRGFSVKKGLNMVKPIKFLCLRKKFCLIKGSR